VINIEQEALWATQETENFSSGRVLECGVASPRDEEMPSDTMCTLSSKGGALLNDVVVIPDTTMYTIGAESIVFDLYCMESEDEQKKMVPFLHTIELHGP
jgi:hypothetical protein